MNKFLNPAVRSTWREAWTLKEQALRTRFARSSEKLNLNARDLKKLAVGDRCMVQNQFGNHPKKWDRSGTVVEVLPFNQYTVRIDGSQRVTKRNWKYLRGYTPATVMIRNSASSSGTPAKQPLSPTSCTVDDIPVPTSDLSHEQVLDGPSLSPSIGDTHYVAKGLSEPDNNPMNTNVKQPLAVRRLKNFNNPGLKEDVEPVKHRLRRH